MNLWRCGRIHRRTHVGTMKPQLLVYQFFFFKQKTAYEMRISDWSSDVCSSDLKLNVGLDWESGPAGLTLRGNRYGSVFIPVGSEGDIDVAKGAAPGDLTLSPQWVVDLELDRKSTRLNSSH